MNKTIIALLVGGVALLSACVAEKPEVLPMTEGKFEPTWESLAQYEAPEWFRNVKFGIWAHWGPQCQPESGDWYARGLYEEGGWQYKAHLKKYGHPSQFGFKDVIHEWKAEKWQPDSLLAFYKQIGAQYFFALANHHDNFDMWDSDYQEWNSVALGPQKNIIAGWERACRNQGIYFGVSVHASHAWCWYETSRKCDRNGAYKNVPYDGWLTKEDGVGTWWEGYDPQELYAQNHPLSLNARHWDWDTTQVVKPSNAYCTKFYNRTLDLIHKYKPDLVYFDDTSLPLSQVSDVGLKIAADFYNFHAAQHNDGDNGVIFAKCLTEDEKNCMTWDVERGAPDKIQAEPWQTCTCIGSWHYDRGIYDRSGYKSPEQVIQMLIDVVSKNGCLLLSVPLRGDGSMDEKERVIMERVGEWMRMNGEAIYDTRPWTAYGEGPVADNANPINAQGFNEGNMGGYSAADFRFTQKADTLYAFAMKCPADGKLFIRSLAGSPVASVTALGASVASFEQTEEGLLVQLAQVTMPEMPVAIKIVF